jgi:hypothetical protein
MLSAKTAVFAQLNTVRGVFLVFLGVVIALLAVVASKHNAGSCVFNCHNDTSFLSGY